MCVCKIRNECDCIQFNDARTIKSSFDRYLAYLFPSRRGGSPAINQRAIFARLRPVSLTKKSLESVSLSDRFTDDRSLSDTSLLSPMDSFDLLFHRSCDKLSRVKTLEKSVPIPLTYQAKIPLQRYCETSETHNTFVSSSFPETSSRETRFVNILLHLEIVVRNDRSRESRVRSTRINPLKAPGIHQ